MPTLKKIIKTCLLTPQLILIKVFFLIEKVYELLFPINISRLGRDAFLKNIDDDFKIIHHKNTSMSFYTPNEVCLFRANTFSIKEPEMLEWIEEFGGEGAFFDIGANIGIYSIYFAKVKEGNVYSFEPSVFNLRQLAKNISINDLSSQIKIVTNPLSNKTSLNSFIHSDISEGGALNAFGVNYGYDGSTINNLVEYILLGFSLDEMFSNGILKEVPSMIKIDVDGIEHLILEGAKNLLTNNQVKSIYIEVNENFSEQSEQIYNILNSSGFTLREKRRSEFLSKSASEDFMKMNNQIWIRN